MYRNQACYQTFLELVVRCCSVVQSSFISTSLSMISCWATSVSLPTCSLILLLYSWPYLVWFSQMSLKTASGSSGVMEGLILLPLMTISMKNFLFLRSVSRGNQLLRYFPETPQRWVTPSDLTRATVSISLKRMVLEVARGKKYLLMTMASRYTFICLSWYRGSLLIQNNSKSPFKFYQLRSDWPRTPYIGF